MKSSLHRSARIRKFGEFDFIRAIPRSLSRHGPSPSLGIGDDAAVLPSMPSKNLVVSTDILVENIHFQTNTATYFDIGYKAAAVNLSDLAAMGATPSFLLVALALPPGFRPKDWNMFYRGLLSCCQTHGVRLIGGDTSASPTGLFVALTIIGEAKPQNYLTRSGATPGDLLFVSGTLGDAAAGLTILQARKQPVPHARLRQPMKHLVRRQLRPSPRILLGQVLAKHQLASAAIDLSDGLSGDLAHLCHQSQVGAWVEESHIPLSSHLEAFAAQNHKPPLSWSLHGGEDYELLFTVPPSSQQRLKRATKRLHVPITQIGIIKPSGYGIRICQGREQSKPLHPQSYDHFSTLS